MINCNVTKEFVLAGRATFTIDNGVRHYTFKVKKPKWFDENNPRARVWFAYILTGADNSSSYTYIGKVNDSLMFALTERSKYNLTSDPVKAIIYALTRVRLQDRLPEGWHIRHSGKCGRCGRRLTVPQSIECGLGPECVTRI